MAKLRMQILVSTIDQKDFSLLDRMNIQSDAIIINQSDENSFLELMHGNHLVKWISLNERGVGLSRNTAWMRADADILLFADDDLVYFDGIHEKIIRVFADNPNVDMFVFDVDIINDNRDIKNYRPIDNMHKLNWYNSMRYGACRFAIRKNALLKANVSYSHMFGGGTPFGSGEDSLFLISCFKKKLNVYTFPLKIASVDSKESSWYRGVNDKYYRDKGALYYNCFPRIYPIIFVVYALRGQKHGGSFIRCMKLFFEGKAIWNNILK